MLSFCDLFLIMTHVYAVLLSCIADRQFSNVLLVVNDVWCNCVWNTSDAGWLCRCLRMRLGFWWRSIWVRSRAGPKSIQPDVSAMSHCLPAIIRTDLLSLHRLLGNSQYYIPLIIDRSDQSINQSIIGQSVTVQKYNHNSELYDNGKTRAHEIWSVTHYKLVTVC